MKPGTRLHRFWLGWVEWDFSLRIGPDKPWVDWEVSLPRWVWRVYCLFAGHTFYMDRATYCVVCSKLQGPEDADDG